MTFAQSHDIRPGQGVPLSTGTIRWMPLISRAIAIAVVVALAAMVDWPGTTTPDSAADQVTSQPNASTGPVFDGRGKWGAPAR